MCYTSRAEPAHLHCLCYAEPVKDSAEVIRAYLRLRAERGTLAPARLSERLGYKKRSSMMSQILNGQRPVPMHRLDVIAAFFHFQSSEDLLTEARRFVTAEQNASADASGEKIDPALLRDLLRQPDRVSSASKTTVQLAGGTDAQARIRELEEQVQGLAKLVTTLREIGAAATRALTESQRFHPEDVRDRTPEPKPRGSA
jgi:hypothetical protein